MAIYLALWALPQSTDRIGRVISKAMKKTGKPIIVATLEGKMCMEKRHVFEDLGVPVFLSLERAAHVAMHLAKKARDKHN